MYHIMVVEDDKELRDLFCAVLSDNVYTPFPACNGYEAFCILENTRTDLIISDIMMPEMDGYEFIEALRKTITPCPC